VVFVFVGPGIEGLVRDLVNDPTRSAAFSIWAPRIEGRGVHKLGGLHKLRDSRPWNALRTEAESMSRSGAHSGRWRRRFGHNPGRWDRLSGQDGRILNKETKNEPTGPRRTGREKARPALRPERVADVLIGGPCFPAWSRQHQADARESLRIAEIGDRERSDLVTPHVSGKLLHRWYATLGKVAIPLTPQRLLLIGEVERVDDLAALPTVVASWLRPIPGVGEVRDLSEPSSGGINRLNVERQRARPQTAPGDSSSETTRATRRALPRAINSRGF